MGYAIARIKKLKRSSLAASEAHTARIRETPNADRSKQNIRFIGSDRNNETLDSLVINFIGQQKRKLRPDAVYAVEILLTASPEYFRPNCPTKAGDYSSELVSAWLAASKQWLEENYGERIVRAELHLDEATPHIHAYFVPLDETGQLRAKHYFDGRQKMRQFQDSYSAATEHLGLERGIKGSRAQHQDIKDFYSIVNQSIEPDTQLPVDQLQAQAADRLRAVRKKQEMERTALSLQKENEILKKRIQQLEAEKISWQQQAQLLRELPLDMVAWELGLERDSTESGRWRGHGHIINIDCAKFYDFSPTASRGGGGAIDLVMHVNGYDFRTAVAWLIDQTIRNSQFAIRNCGRNCQLAHSGYKPPLKSKISVDLNQWWVQAPTDLIANCDLRIANWFDRFGEEGAQRAAVAHAIDEAKAIALTQPKPEPLIPTPDESKWHSCREYLTQRRGIPARTIDSLHQAGRIYADARGNAVFLMRDHEGNPTGAYLRGEGDFKGYTLGTRRSEGHFYFGMGDGDQFALAVLCKSPIDALSAAALQESKFKTVYIAVDSVSTLPKLKDFLSNMPVVVAHDGDESGLRLAAAITALLPHAQTTSAPPNMDWNDALLRHLAQERQKRSQSKRQQPDLEL